MKGSMVVSNTRAKSKIRYEIKPKGTPFFGATSNAKAALERNRLELIKPFAFCDYLSEKYADDEAIEYISFYDFSHTNRNNFHFTIAVIYTKPDRSARDRLFIDREKITKETGWYPLITGSRANYTSQYMDISVYQRIKARKFNIHIGSPISIKNIAIDPSSTALYLKGSKGAILLDTGFGIDSKYVDLIDSVFLSHFHKDHSGGLLDILRKRNIPILMSMLTLEQLLCFCKNESDRNLIINNSFIVDTNRNTSSSTSESSCEFIQVYHCPGSTGLLYKHGQIVVIYPGDLCLENAFYIYSSELLSVIKKYREQGCIIHVLLDSSVAYKLDSGQPFEESQEIIIDRSKKNICIIGSGPETLTTI